MNGSRKLFQPERDAHEPSAYELMAVQILLIGLFLLAAAALRLFSPEEVRAAFEQLRGGIGAEFVRLLSAAAGGA
ncbi:MAG: hypothetical protein QM689_11025 [Oscillospiraceae bacterium]